ncbi:MAG: M48 family metallopeptidase [Pseudomonadota bacterium]
MTDHQKQRNITLDTSKQVPMSRRQLLNGLAAGSVVAFTTSCSTNPVTGRDQFILVSDQQLAQLGSQTWQALLADAPVQDVDTKQTTELREIGDRIVAAAGPNVPASNWDYRVFDDEQINAFVMPGGKVGFYDGILDVMENESQVAAVMGHEVGHVAGRHAAERYSQQLAAGVALTATSIALNQADVEYAGQIGAVLGVGLQFGVLLPYSRRHEIEADRLGMRYMAAAGYDPRENLKFWETMMDLGDKRQKPPEFLSTHPSDETRLRILTEELKLIEAA